MKLVAFRVQNYKKIGDTGWITVRDLTAFVGKNEAGKSALFRGLSKLNPSDGEKYDGLKEFPRRRYTDEFQKQDWPVASGKFELDDSDREQLSKICPALEDAKHVRCTRHYCWKLAVEFEPPPSISILTRSEFKTAIEELRQKLSDLTAPEAKGEALGAMKSALLQTLDQLGNQQSARHPDEVIRKAEVQRLTDAIATQSNEEWQKEILKDISQTAQELLTRASFAEELEQAKQWVEKTCQSSSTLTATM